MQDFAHTAERDISEVLKAAKSGFPPVSQIPYLPGEPLNPQWWKILVGRGQDKDYLHTHVEAWVRMLTTGTTSEGRTWTMMYPQFIEELCTNKISDRGVLMAKGKMANLGWPAWSSTEKVIMPTALNNHYWIVAVLHWDNTSVEFFDTDDGDALHEAITMIYDRIKKNLPAFFKEDRAKRTS